MKLFSYILPFVLILASCGQEVTTKPNNKKTTPSPDEKKVISGQGVSHSEYEYSEDDGYKFITPELINDISSFNIKGLDKPICTIKDAALNAFGDDEITLFKNNLYYTNTKNEMVSFDPIKDKKIWANNEIDWTDEYIDFDRIIDDIALNNAFNIKTGKFLIPFTKEDPISVIDTEKDCIITTDEIAVSKYNYKTNKTIWTTALNKPKEAHVDAVYSRGIVGNCLIINGQYGRGKGECMNKYASDITYKHFEHPADYLFAINTNNGEMCFSYKNCDTYQINNDKKKIYICIDGKIVCYDIIGNREEWIVDLKGNKLITLDDEYALAQTSFGYSLFNMSNGKLSWEFKVPYKEFLLKDYFIDEQNISLDIYSDHFLVDDGYCGKLIDFHKLESFIIKLSDGQLIQKKKVFDQADITVGPKEKRIGDFYVTKMSSSRGINILDLEGTLIQEIKDIGYLPTDVHKDYYGLHVDFGNDVYTYNNGVLTSSYSKEYIPDMFHYEINNLYLDFYSNESLTVEDMENKTFAYYFLKNYWPRTETIFQDGKYIYIESTYGGLLIVDLAKNKLCYLKNFVMIKDYLSQEPLKTTRFVYERVGESVNIYAFDKPLKTIHYNCVRNKCSP